MRCSGVVPRRAGLDLRRPGYLMRAARLSPALLVIGLVLGTMLERSFRQAYLLANGNLLDMLVKPLTSRSLVSRSLRSSRTSCEAR